MASLGPEIITEIGGMPITNTLITTLVVDIVVITLAIIVFKKIKLVPAGLQSVFEPIIEYLLDLTQQISGTKARTIFPWFASFFLFILFANLIGLFPGFGSIGFWESSTHETTTHQEASSETSQSHETVTENPTTAHETTTTTEHEEVTAITSHENTQTTHETSAAAEEEVAQTEEKHLVPVFRAITSDFNVTLALATISIVGTHIISIRFNGFKGYLGKFLSKNPILLFVGLLEFLLEFVKIFSLSFRLFGNILAGEIVLLTVAGLFAFLVPIPFTFLEIIVALVQALVFAMLTMVFMSLLATTSSEGGGH